MTLLNVDCRVRTGDGKEAWGFGSMTLGNASAFPAAPHEVGLGAMTALAAELRGQTAACDEIGHPVDLFRVLEPAYLSAADGCPRERALPVPIPKLCTLVVASAFDAAIHDAYGKAFGVSCYGMYGPRFMRRDLSADRARSSRANISTATSPCAETTLVFHSVGAFDRLEASDAGATIDDGLPGTLEEWIARDGLLAFKMNSTAAHDCRRRAHRADRSRRDARAGIQAGRDWKYLLDFNEGCPNVAYLIEVLQRVREATPSGFERILDIEQPTNRDLKKDRANVMHAAARLRPSWPTSR